MAVDKVAVLKVVSVKVTPVLEGVIVKVKSSSVVVVVVVVCIFRFKSSTF